MTYFEFKVNLRHIGEGFRWHQPEFVILQRPIIVRRKENSASNESVRERRGDKRNRKRGESSVQNFGVHHDSGRVLG